jgi:hypothetical protein
LRPNCARAIGRRLYRRIRERFGRLAPKEKLATSGDGSFYHDGCWQRKLKKPKKLDEMFVNDLLGLPSKLAAAFSQELCLNLCLTINAANDAVC